MAVLNARGEVRAAGGVVVRAAGSGVEVLVVHRPRYDDWSLPKGKAEPAETDEACALREVEEETGLRCSLGRELATVRYRDRFRRAKSARYWEMTTVGGEFAPTSEVDAVEWLSPAEAIERLSYERDVEVLTPYLAVDQTWHA